jgi:ATP-dependent exoDNAse (exonuclease V) beta subunit
MSEPPVDQAARARFRDEWTRNFAVSASAGSGKTTAISERLAAMALAPAGAELLRQTAVVTFTRKAAAQIGQRARHVLLRRLAEEGRTDLAPLDHLERAFFGTIHSFCLLLAQRHGQTLGINLNPSVVPENDDALWEEFLEQDPMQFASLAPAQTDAFLRHAPLDSVFELARGLDLATARSLGKKIPASAPAGPAENVLREILAATSKGKGALALKGNQDTAVEWLWRFREERGYLPMPRPVGSAAGIKELFSRYFAPVKAWLAGAGAVLAAELALRYRAWRFDRGVQTYADQIEAALAVLHDATTLEKIRAEGWRVILDEAQDTDPQQFAVLAEIARPPGAPLGTWPGPGAGPRAGHFCMVGDGQQAIYSSRADIRNFQRHIAAFAAGSGGELLTFAVTFRAPHRVIERLNATLPAAFSREREHNCGLPPAEGAPAPLLQVNYEPLVAGPGNAGGAVGVLPLVAPGAGKMKVEAQLACEVRQIAARLRAGGPGSVGARNWGEICLLAPRNEWLITARKELEAAGLKAALQMRRNRNGDNPVYAWTAGLLAALCDPDNAFEWTGVLREVFAVSDAQLAAALRAEKRFHWDEPGRHEEPLRAALAALQPFVGRVDAEGEPLERFFTDLARACGLAEKARALDPGGALAAELERLHAHAAERGLAGAGPRAWRDELLAAIDEGRPAGKPSEDAINLLTAHSAKGLEWPVVIPIGLWRTIGKAPETGLRLMPDAAGPAQVFFDSDSLPADMREARERERLRENVRLLYVVLTRPRRVLVLPWGADFAPVGEGSFLDLWGADLADIPPVQAEDPGFSPTGPGEPVKVAAPETAPALKFEAATPLPARVLPHQLANQPDLARATRHESGLDEPRPARSGGDPLDYGVWWHETMEFIPWTGDDAAVRAYGERAVAVTAAQGFGERGGEEWARLLASEAWRELRSPRWTRLAELAVFAPLRADAWIDGVMDLAIHDPAANEVWILDWKTNRRIAGEDDEQLLARLVGEYAPQLRAYGACAAGFFPGCTIRLLVFSTATGSWREVPVA